MINKRIKKVREDSGLSQADFAKRLLVSQPYISRIEKGLSDPSKKLIKLLCFNFGINEKWLLEGKGSITIDSGITIKEFSVFTENIEANSKEALINIFDVYALIIDNMTKNIDSVLFSDCDWDDKDRELLKAKRNLMSAIEHLGISVDKLFI